MRITIKTIADYTLNYCRSQYQDAHQKQHHIPPVSGEHSPYNTQVKSPLDKASSAYNPSTDNLRNLLLIRSFALLGQGGVLAYVAVLDKASENLAGVTTSLLVLTLLTLASLWRTARAWPVEDREFLLQLLIDVMGWTALMYFTGGANNPFVSYYIVPVVIAAAVLPWRYTWIVAGSSLVAYSLLLFIYQPFPIFTPHSGMAHGEGTTTHIFGMWFNFLFSVGLITFFVVRMATTLRRQEAQIGIRREDRLRNDQIMAVASLAAGTAHELGTPLSTMTVLVEEMLHNDQIDDLTRADCMRLQNQLDQCKATLSELSRTAEFTSIDKKRLETVEEFARKTLARWAVRRPGTSYHFECAADSPTINTDTTLGQALENLLNNAADTGTAELSVTVSWDSEWTKIGIRDWGPGIDAELVGQLGKPLLHADQTGLGIGLMLSQATVERYGGKIELRNMHDGGAIAILSLPLPENSPVAEAP